MSNAHSYRALLEQAVSLFELEDYKVGCDAWVWLQQSREALKEASAGPAREQIEAFRKENLIEGHGDGRPGIAQWAVESNFVLNYLCDLALAPAKDHAPDRSATKDG